MSLKSWVLTDVSERVWTESTSITSKDLGIPDDQSWSVTKSTLRGGLSDGVDIIEVDNGALRYTIVPTRGMGIWRGYFKDQRLGWDAPVRGPVHPAFVNQQDRGGIGWIGGFDEWIVRCGLDSNGAPGEDVILDNNGNPSSVTLTLHGKIANIPAHYVEVKAETKPPYKITVAGHVEESMLFSPQLKLNAAVSTWPNSNRIVIDDEVTNLKAVAAELELLYHCNFGKPFLDTDAQLIAPIREVAPRDPRAAEGIDHFASYLGPTPGYVEQVYWYDLKTDGQNQTMAMLANGARDKAVVLRYDKTQLPYFTQWKNTASDADGYVTGLEPGTNFPNQKKFERESGRVIKLHPSGAYQCQLVIEVHDNGPDVAKAAAEIGDIQGNEAPQVHPNAIAKYSPA